MTGPQVRGNEVIHVDVCPECCGEGFVEFFSCRHSGNCPCGSTETRDCETCVDGQVEVNDCSCAECCELADGLGVECGCGRCHNCRLLRNNSEGPLTLGRHNLLEQWRAAREFSEAAAP